MTPCGIYFAVQMKCSFLMKWRFLALTFWVLSRLQPAVAPAAQNWKARWACSGSLKEAPVPFSSFVLLHYCPRPGTVCFRPLSVIFAFLSCPRSDLGIVTYPSSKCISLRHFLLWYHPSHLHSLPQQQRTLTTRLYSHMVCLIPVRSSFSR